MLMGSRDREGSISSLRRKETKIFSDLTDSNSTGYEQNWRLTWHYQAKWSHCYVSSCGNCSLFAGGPATDPSMMTRVVSASRKEKADRPIGLSHRGKIIVGRDSCSRLETRSNIHRWSNACRSVGAAEAGDHCIITISTSGTGNASTSIRISNTVSLHMPTFDIWSLMVVVG